jgi:sortase (surface protein transpeptidase)
MPGGTVPVAANAKVVSPTKNAARPVAAPSGLSVPSIGLDVGTPEQLGLDGAGQLAAPVDFDRIGWYAQGPKPGEAGPAVIVGHVDSFRGPAVFFRLDEIRPGQQIVVPRSDGRRTTFTVDAVRKFAKDAFPSEQVYGPTANAQLRLITCGGTFDRSARSYEDNVVVFASVH